MNNPLDFAIRVCESIAFSLHAILGITEPWTGCLRGAFRDEGIKGGMPNWFWPIAGSMLLIVACANFSENKVVILIAQAYIAAFHSGAVFYHLTLGHHPVTGCAPAVFIVMAYIVMYLRTNALVATLITITAVAVAAGLSKILVYPPKTNRNTDDKRSTSHTHLLHD